MINISKSSYRLIKPTNFFLNPKEFQFYNNIISFVNNIDSFFSPKVNLEQYTLPSDLIALILILSTKDLKGKNVVDLGCGTGRFTLPIKKFYANDVLGVDIDLKVMITLLQLRKWANLDVELLMTAIEFLEPDKWRKKFQTTLMNPPFGTKRRNIDLIFLEKALEFSETVISIHKSNRRTQELIRSTGDVYGKELAVLVTVEFPIPPNLQFHRKKKHFVCVDIIRLGS